MPKPCVTKPTWLKKDEDGPSPSFFTHELGPVTPPRHASNPFSSSLRTSVEATMRGHMNEWWRKDLWREEDPQANTLQQVIDKSSTHFIEGAGPYPCVKFAPVGGDLGQKFVRRHARGCGQLQFVSNLLTDRFAPRPFGPCSRSMA